MAISLATATAVPTRAVGLSSVPANPKALGNCWVLTTQVQTTAVSTTGVSGGGVTTWTRLIGPFAAEGGNIDIWLGTITALGSSTITAAGISASGVNNMLMLTEFTNGSGSGTTWAKDGTQSGTLTNSVAATAVLFPSLTPAAAGELYFGYSQVQGSANTTGPTPAGFTVVLDGAVNPMIWGLTPSTAALQPTAQEASGTSGSVGALVVATAPVTGPPPGQFFPLLAA